MGRLHVKRSLILISLVALSLAALADVPADTLQLNEVRHIRMMHDGSLVDVTSDAGPRVNTVWYGCTNPLYYSTGSLPNWHGGDICSFAPENAGVTDTLINLVTFPIRI